MNLPVLRFALFDFNFFHVHFPVFSLVLTRKMTRVTITMGTTPKFSRFLVQIHRSREAAFKINSRNHLHFLIFT